MKRRILFAVLLVSSVAIAQGKDGKVVKSARDEISRMQRELDSQRALLVRILEIQAQQYAALAKLAKGELAAADSVVSVPAPEKRVEEPAEPAPSSSGHERSRSSSKAAPKTATGTVKGKVSFRGGASGPAWVFVEDIGGHSDRSLEIKQEDKQFSPRIAAVPRGAKLLFANYDSIFHNVFSASKGNSFDIGTTRSGDPAKPYVTASPGVIEIFCNMHSKMSSMVLVAPGPHLVRVQPDGTYKLDDVPVGNHKIGGWAGAAIVSKDVDVGTSGAEANFELQVGDTGSAHKNKHGQAYGSYGD